MGVAEYHDENLRLPKNSSVVVKRVPTARPKLMVGGAQPEPAPLPTTIARPPAAAAAPIPPMHNAYAPSRAAPPAYQSALPPPPPVSGDGGDGGGDGADAEIAAFMSSTGACARLAVVACYSHTQRLRLAF